MLNIKSTLFVLLAMAGLPFAQARAQAPADSPLGVYSKPSTFCGGGTIAQNPTTIPQIGCFHLSSGHAASGTFSMHRVEVSLDNAGNEAFKVDGALITDTGNTASGTNLAYVGAGGVAGYRFCEGPTDRNNGCPASITIYSRAADKSVLFMVSQCMGPKYRVCVLTQENWDYEKSRQH
jgi:hypothetical protein